MSSKFVVYKGKENFSGNSLNNVAKDAANFKSKIIQTSTTAVKYNQEQACNSPSPDNFITFLPWACGQLGVNEYIYIKRLKESQHKPTQKQKESRNDAKEKETKSRSPLSDKGKSSVVDNADNFVVLEATYLTNDLTALKFDNNKRIPRLVFKILGEIIRFYPKLSNITINRGVDQFVIYEISNFLPVSQITELILDNCPVSQGNYNILLDEPSKLTYLSLARCSIGDRILSLICKKLVYPKPASKTLTILNLSSNQITDMGAGYVAKFLRSNRRLRYINLSGNFLTDNGAETILSSLMEFQLTTEECISFKRRNTEYLKTRNDFISRLVEGMKDSGEYEKARRLQRSTLTGATLRKLKSLEDTEANKTGDTFPDKMTFYYRKALVMLPNLFGKFDDPFNEDDAISKDTNLFSNGNGVLCYLNLAYNGLGEYTAKKLVRTLKHQQSLNREQKGLTVVRLDGNPIPETCKEMTELEALFDKTLSAVSEPKRKLHKVHSFSHIKSRPKLNKK